MRQAARVRRASPPIALVDASLPAECTHGFGPICKNASIKPAQGIVSRAGVMRLSVGLGFGGALGLSVIGSASPGEAADAQRFSWAWVRLPGAETCAAAEEIAGEVRA